MAQTSVKVIDVLALLGHRCLGTYQIGLTIEEIARALEISPEKAEQIEKIAKRNGFWKYIDEQDRENGESRS